MGICAAITKRQFSRDNDPNENRGAAYSGAMPKPDPTATPMLPGNSKHWLKWLRAHPCNSKAECFMFKKAWLIFLVRFQSSCEPVENRLGSGFHRPFTAVMMCFTADTEMLLISKVYVCAESEWVILSNRCEVGSAYGMHQYLRCVFLWGWRCLNPSVIILCVCVCRRQEVGSIASRCWRQSRNSLNIRSPSFPAPTPKSKYSKFQEIGSGWLQKVSFLPQKHLWWAPHLETDLEFQLNPWKANKRKTDKE